MRQSILLGIVVVSILIAATACNPTAAPGQQSAAPASAPAEVTDAAQAAWEHYKWSEKVPGGVRGGGWHLAPADASASFEIVQAGKGTLPAELKALMTGGKGYQDDVWCVSFKPPLYFGTTPEDGTRTRMGNMLFFQGRDGAWHELGNVWNERWVTYLYKKDVYKVSLNFYRGPMQAMFEKMGCSNWKSN